VQRRNFTLASILFSLLLSLRIEIFITSILFPMVDSLVRVTRRDKWNYFQFDVSVRLSIALFDRRLKNRQQYASCVGIDGLDQLFNDPIPRTICEVIWLTTTFPRTFLMNSLIESNVLRRGKVLQSVRFSRHSPDLPRPTIFTNFHLFPLVWFQVLISLSSQSSLHLSFTVLFRYRSPYNI